MGRVEIVTLTVGARAKEGKGGGGEEKKILFSLPAPSLAPSPPLFGKFQHGAFASKLRAQRKRLHCRLTRLVCFVIIIMIDGSADGGKRTLNDITSETSCCADVSQTI